MRVELSANLAVGLALLAFACNEGPQSASSDGSGAATSEAATSGAEPEHLDLWACGLERDCLLSEHFFRTEPGIPGECAVAAVRAEQPAVFVVAPYAVPFCADWGRLMVLVGDGTVFVQSSSADAGPECEDHPTMLEAGPQLRCELDLPQDFDALMKWFPAIKGCVEGEWLTCETLHALLGER